MELKKNPDGNKFSIFWENSQQTGSTVNNYSFLVHGYRRHFYSDPLSIIENWYPSELVGKEEEEEGGGFIGI